MPAYSTDWIKRLNQLRETNPEAVRQIEERADEIYEGYSEAEVYSRGGVAKTPGARWQDAGRDSRARAMEQALGEYERMAGATGTQAIADLPEEDPLAGLPERDLEPEPSLETEIVPEEERDRYPTIARQEESPYFREGKDVEFISSSRPEVLPEEGIDQPDDVELTPFSMSDIEDLEDPTLLQRLGRFAKSDQGLSVLQALAKGGQAYMGSRAQSEANQRTRQSQARANLINALSSRAGARGTVEKPRMGKLGTLFGTLADIGGGIGKERKAEREMERKQREMERKQEESAALRDYRSKQLELQERGQEITLERDQAARERTVQRDQLAQDKVAADGLKKMIMSSVESGQARSLEQFFKSNPDAKAKYDNLSGPYQTLVESGFNEGFVKYQKALAKQGKSLESAEVESAVTVLKGAWDRIEGEGDWKAMAKESLRRVMPELWAGHVQPAETTYMDQRSGLSLPIASAFNQGRPSNADAEAVLRLLPQVGEAREVSDAKWEALQQLIALKREAEDRGLVLAPPETPFLSLGVITMVDGVPTINREKALELMQGYSVGKTAESASAESKTELVYEKID